MARLGINVGGGEVLAASTAGHADGRYRVYVDISNVAGTETVDLAVRNLQDIIHPGTLLGAFTTATLILSTLQQHGTDGG